ncbi:uncharacterized protein BJ171DRAFT_520547, partial [Polychytrium aggregatum]|uniref:uncharacterized protein n=1 Tax=Polychytrium aggregatum TaxID=110093 RepID=UPI0022FE42C1
MTDSQLAERHWAAKKISSAWRKSHYRRVFRQLKEKIFLAERSMTVDIIKKLCPIEMEFLCEPVIQTRVRFRSVSEDQARPMGERTLLAKALSTSGDRIDSNWF